MIDVLEQVRKDMEFLLSFTPASDPSEVEPNLTTMFYITGTYEGDVKIAEKVKAIRDRYDIMTIDPEEEDFEGVEQNIF